MCGRTRCTLDPESVALVRNVQTKNWVDKEKYRPSYNVSPGRYTPIILKAGGTKDGSGNSLPKGATENVIQSMKWGLVPSFTKKDEKPDYFRMFNARSESVAEKASFRRLLPRNRCIALADGFFEWKKEGSKKQPFYLHFENDDPLCFAALYDSWTDSTGERMYTYTILTTSSSTRLEWLHDRMPVILRGQEDVDAWLDGEEFGASETRTLAKPYSGADLIWHPVTPAMGRPSFDCHECVEEIKQKEVKESSIAQMFRRHQTETTSSEIKEAPEGPLKKGHGTTMPPRVNSKIDHGIELEPDADDRMIEESISSFERKAFEAGVSPDRDVSCAHEHSKSGSEGAPNSKKQYPNEDEASRRGIVNAETCVSNSLHGIPEAALHVRESTPVPAATGVCPSEAVTSTLKSGSKRMREGGQKPQKLSPSSTKRTKDRSASKAEKLSQPSLHSFFSKG